MSFRWLLPLILTLISTSTSAGVLFDIDAAAFQAALNNGTASTETRMLYGGGIFVNVDKKGKFYLGAQMLSGSVVETGTNASTLTHQDIVLSFKYAIDKQGLFLVSGGYGVLSTVGYKDTTVTTTEAWRGTSMYGKFTVAPEVAENLTLGLSLLYYSGAYAKKESGTTVTTISNSRSTILPSVGLSYSW